MQICLWAKKIDTIVWESFYCDSKGSWLFSQEVTAKINNLPNNNAAAQIICKYGHFSTKTCVCLYFGQWKCIYQQKSWLLFSFTRNTQCQYQSKPTVIVVLLLSKLHIVGFHQISIFHLYCDKIHYWSNTFVLFRVYVISDPDRNLMGKTSKGSVK